MKLEEFIESNPSRDELVEALCGIANNNVLEIDETYAWDKLSDLGHFKLDDFYDDTQETIEKHGSESVEVFGMKNWKLKNK